MTILVPVVVLTITGLLIVWHERRTTERWEIVTDDSTPEGIAFCDAIADHLNRGGTLGDILGGQVTRHPSGAVHVHLITTNDADHLAVEAEAYLAGREPRR